MKKINLSFLFILFFIKLIQPINAIENLHFEWISDQQGLSHNTVRALMQDNMGFIWAGTVSGLNRYNGRGFEKLLPQNSTFVNVSDNRIQTVKQDKHGYLWIYTAAQIICCYDIRTEQFVDFAPTDRKKEFFSIRIFSNDDVWLFGDNNGCSLVQHTDDGNLKTKNFGKALLGSNNIAFVHEDKYKNIWICTTGGKGLFRMKNGMPSLVSSEEFLRVCEIDGKLFLINRKNIVQYNNGKLESVVRFSEGLKEITSATPVNNKFLMIGTPDLTYAFDLKTKKFAPALSFFNGENITKAQSLIDANKKAWFFNNTGIIWRQNADNKFTKIQLIPPHIIKTITNERFNICIDSRGITWITTYGNGLFAISPDNQIQHFTTKNSDISSDFLLSIMEDKSGQIWVGTENGGISKISLTNLPINIILPKPTGSNHIYDNAVRLIYENSAGQYWVGTRSGDLYLYDQHFNLLHTLKLNNDVAFKIIEDHKKRLWLGTRTREMGLLISENYGKSFSQINEKRLRGIYDMLIDHKNRLWIATFNQGLFVTDLNNEVRYFKQLNFENKNQNILRVMLQDSQGIIWLGTNGGITAFNPDSLLANKNNYLNFHFETNNSNSLNNNEVKAIYEDSKKQLWFGTTGGGLNLLKRDMPLKNSTFKHYNIKNGLSNEVIQAILEDNAGNIWVSTESGSGISKFNPTTEKFENFTVSVGKHAGLFNENTAWKMKNGNLLFGGYSGLYLFNPKKMKLNNYAPPVILSGLKINGVGVKPNENESPLEENITFSKKIKLEYDQNSFNIEFAMHNYFQPNNNQYAYYLDGFEQDWNSATNYNVASYRNVPPGTYTFKVKGSNSLGVWTEKETELIIVISPPFYKSVWAYLIYILMLVTAAYFTVKISMKFQRLNMAIDMEKKLTEFKLKFFTNISHEFRTPLTIIRGIIDNLRESNSLNDSDRNQVSLLTKSSVRLMRLVEQLLEFRKLQNDKLELNVEKTEVVNFLYDIYHIFNEMANKKKIALRFESNLPQYEMLLDRSIWDKISYNFLSNAMKHTPVGGKIVMKLDFSEINDTLTVSVSDNGKGVAPEKQSELFTRFAQFNPTIGGTGIGLHLTSEIASLHKGNIAYKQSEFGGACFYVTIPLSDKNYSQNLISTLEQTQTTEVPKTEREIVFDSSITEEVGIPENETPSPEYKNHKLLIIEDDDEVQDFLSNSMSPFFTVFSAKDGEEGLEIAKQEEPHIIVCDVMMPGISGFEVTRHLKSDFLTSHIPVILLTAHTSEQHKLEGIQSGADSYITKPFSVKYLMARIVKLIEQREKLQQRFSQSSGVSSYQINFTDKDKEFIEKIQLEILNNLTNTSFTVDTLAEKFKIGRTSFFKKMKGITGHSPNEYINIIRMKKAAELLANSDMNISEISYQIGMEDPSYFTRYFKSQFGKTPLQFRKDKG